MDPYIAKLAGWTKDQDVKTPAVEPLKVYAKGERTFIVIRRVLSTDEHTVLRANTETLRLLHEGSRREEERRRAYAHRGGAL